MPTQSLLNRELTNYFNDVIGTIKNADVIGLEPGQKPFHNIKSMHYNEATETILIEMENTINIISLIPGTSDKLVLHEYDTPKKEGA